MDAGESSRSPFLSLSPAMAGGGWWCIGVVPALETGCDVSGRLAMLEVWNVMGRRWRADEMGDGALRGD